MKAVALHSTSEGAPARKRRQAVGLPVPISQFPQTALVNEAPIQRKAACACGGGCPRCAGESHHPNVQTKLTVTTPGDHYEQEADRVGDEVLAKPAHPAVDGVPSRIQRFTAQATGQAEAAPASVDQVLASPGRPMEPVLRQEMEQRFGHDFSSVRVHSGAAAESSARDVSAHGYTVGHDVVFGAGRFAPSTNEGRRLIAHELTHVVQQSGGALAVRPIGSGGAIFRKMTEQSLLAGQDAKTKQQLMYDKVKDTKPISFKQSVDLGDKVVAPNIEQRYEWACPSIDAVKDENKRRQMNVGLKAYARFLFDLHPDGATGKADHPRLNLVAIREIDMTEWGGPKTRFRFSCVEEKAKAPTIKVRVLLEELNDREALADKSHLLSMQETANKLGIKRDAATLGDDTDWNRVLLSLRNMKDLLLARMPSNCTFEVSSAETGKKGEAAEFAAHFDPSSKTWTNKIILYASLLRVDDENFTFLIAHEVGHAIDNATAQTAKGPGGRLGRDDPAFKKAALADGGRSKAVTDYGKTDDEEFYAECFALYVSDWWTLWNMRPNIYAYFKNFDFDGVKDPKLVERVRKVNP